MAELPQAVRSLIEQLSLPQLETLGEVLLDFTSLTDLEAWFREQFEGDRSQTVAKKPAFGNDR